MKIRINDDVAVTVNCIEQSQCKNGASYWHIDFIFSGICVHTASIGPIFGLPNVIALLDFEFDVKFYHFQDIPNPVPLPDDRTGRNIVNGTSSSRPCWWEVFSTTHRQAIIDSVGQIID